MTNEERENKAQRYEQIVLEGDRLQRELSKIKSANAGISTTSKEYDNKVSELNKKLYRLEDEMKRLFIDY